ncbi:LexA family protein [Sphingobium abikonense]|uniref:LexA family protein n=1 Tax=Sphingobium abikonense TaxID=86193 RepID=UPI003514DF7A
MTPEMRRTLTLVQDYYAQHGVSPSLRKLAEMEGLSSVGSTHRRVHKLIERGYLVQLKGRNNSFAPASAMPNLADFSDDQLRAELAKRGVGHG